MQCVFRTVGLILTFARANARLEPLQKKYLLAELVECVSERTKRARQHMHWPDAWPVFLHYLHMPGPFGIEAQE